MAFSKLSVDDYSVGVPEYIVGALDGITDGCIEGDTELAGLDEGRLLTLGTAEMVGACVGLRVGLAVGKDDG